jgi:adenylate cyclase
VAFDVHFIEPRIAEDDTLFAESCQNAQNVILCEPLVTRELPTSENGAAVAGFHNIVKIVKPFELLADSAVATAPFTLPRIPFKVNRYWTFQTGAGDSPTVPVVAFQFSTLELYDEFLQLLEKASPDQGLEQKMLLELENARLQLGDGEDYQLLKALIKMYGGATSRYINYYGPPRTITTIPYYKALQIKDGMYDGKPMDIKGKAVFVGLSEILLADRKDSFYTVFSTADGQLLYRIFNGRRYFCQRGGDHGQCFCKYKRRHPGTAHQLEILYYCRAFLGYAARYCLPYIKHENRRPECNRFKFFLPCSRCLYVQSK